MNRQPRALLSVLLLGALAFTGWLVYRDVQPPPVGPTAPVAPAAPVRGGTVTSSLRSEPRSFNRIAARDFPNDLCSLLTLGKLVRLDRARQTIEPWLAEKWDTSADGRTFTLTLREGLAWSDGVPFTSADVLFTFQAIYDPRVSSIIESALRIDGKPLAVAAPDARTVVVTYPAPFAPGIELLDNVTVMPKHKLQAALDAGTFAQAWSAATPPGDMVSIGPFVLARYEPGQRLVFDRNPHYWRKDAAGVGLPYLDHLVFEIVPDQNAELVRLQSGAIDMLQQQIRPEDIATLRPMVDQKKLQLLELGVSTDPDAFFFNLRPEQWAKDPRRAWLPRKEFRQAISHAIDREAFANTVFLGAAVPIWGPISPGNQHWFSPNVKRYPHSLDKARELLKSIGLENRDADEWLEDAAGTEARFTLVTYRGNSSLERSSFVLRDELKKVGINVDVQLLEQGALIERMLTGKFESIFFLFSNSSLDPALNSDFWLSSGSAHIWNIGQKTPATDWEREIDRLMGQMSSSGDLEARKQVFNEVQQVMAENVPALFFVAQRLYMGVSTRVGSLSPSFLRPQLLWSADTISVHP
ncbi:MAG: ABC transporter substrate-binding protein [Vicinamibacterales bacterium]